MSWLEGWLNCSRTVVKSVAALLGGEKFAQVGGNQGKRGDEIRWLPDSTRLTLW